MIRCGQLCKSCGSTCRQEFESRILFECPSCGGEGCRHCDDGYFQLEKCPREFIGHEFIEAINMACMNDLLPVAGGLMDQTPWFLQLKRVFASDCSQIQNERTESNVQ